MTDDTRAELLPDGWRVCDKCGCRTNAKQRWCCEAGRKADAERTRCAAIARKHGAEDAAREIET